MRAAAWVVLGVGAAALFASRDVGESGSELPMADMPPIDDATQPGHDSTDVNGFPIEIEAPAMTEIPAFNLDALLYAIRASEHVFPRDVVNNDCYGIFYGGSRFTDFSDHPVITGEKSGVPLPDHFCRAAGLRPGCVSTAAGAYQIIRPTWISARDDGPRLPDFSPASQDEAARRLLRRSGALAALERNDFNGAIAKASKLWASLPGSLAKQGGRTLDFVTARFNEFPGNLA